MEQAGRYQQLFLVDSNGKVLSRDIPKVLGAIKCGPELKAAKLPSGYNQSVMRVRRQFAEEVKHRQFDQGATCSLEDASPRQAWRYMGPIQRIHHHRPGIYEGD